jgi:hypothetical protein
MIRVSRFRRRAYPGPIGPRLRDFLQTIRKEGDDMVLEIFVGKIVRIVDTYSPLNFI